MRLQLRLPLGSRMGCVLIFAIVIAIPIHPTEKNQNRVINRRCEWTIRVHSHRAKVNAKTNIFFDVWIFFFDLFRLFFDFFAYAFAFAQCEWTITLHHARGEDVNYTLIHVIRLSYIGLYWYHRFLQDIESEASQKKQREISLMINYQIDNFTFVHQI